MQLAVLILETLGAVMRTAITVVKESGRISPLFDTSESLVLITCIRNHAAEIESLPFPGMVPEKIELLQKYGVDLLICGAVSNEDLKQMTLQNLKVCPFASGIWREVWREWSGCRRLTASHLLPGCCRHHKKCCRKQYRKGGLL